MNHYDALAEAVVKNIDNAIEASSTSLAASNTYIAIAQVQAIMALAEAVRNLAPKPTSPHLPPL